MGNLNDVMEDEKPSDQSDEDEESGKDESESADEDSEEESPKKGKAPAKPRASVKKTEEAPSRLPTLSKDTTPPLGDLVERNELGLTDKAKRMKAHLAEQELVNTMIPLNQGEAAGTFMDFSLNGYSFSIPKGRYIKIPRQISDMAMTSLGMDQNILQNHALNLANRDSDAKRALNF